MAKSPTKTPARKSANAPRAAAAPAKKVETPAKAQEPEDTPSTGSAPAPDEVAGAAGSTGLEPDTTSQGQADLEGKSTAGTTPTDHATAAAGIAATGPGAEISTEQQEEIYKRGYSEGFSAALDELADGGNSNADGATGQGQIDYRDQGETGPGYDRTALIALALFTPENQRKGGIAVVVDRLQEFIESLDLQDRWPAIQFMHTLAHTKPLDLATGRFKMVINESLKALNGDTSTETAAERGEDVAARFGQAFQQEDEKETITGPDDIADADLEDADSAASAAARLAGA